MRHDDTPDDERENFLENHLDALLRLIVDKFYGKNAPEDIGEMTTMPGLSMNASTYPPPVEPP